MNKRQFIVGVIVAIGIVLGIFYCLDTTPLSKRMYLTDERTEQRYQKHWKDIETILEPYDICLKDYLVVNLENHSYYAEIPLQNEDVLIIDVLRHTARQYPRCIITLKSSAYSSWEDVIMPLDEYSFVFEILAYYSGNRLDVNKINTVASALQDKTHAEIYSEKDDMCYQSQDLKGYLVKIAELHYGCLYDFKDSGKYESELVYYGDALI